MIIKISIPNRIKLKKVASLRAVFWPKEGEIHYIGGADVLPAPLSPLSLLQGLLYSLPRKLHYPPFLVLLPVVTPPFPSAPHS